MIALWFYLHSSDNSHINLPGDGGISNTLFLLRLQSQKEVPRQLFWWREATFKLT